ncbi:hypothetical protein Trydic_g12384 [Trypoxylus dichotomus]
MRWNTLLLTNIQSNDVLALAQMIFTQISNPGNSHTKTNWVVDPYGNVVEQEELVRVSSDKEFKAVQNGVSTVPASKRYINYLSLWTVIRMFLIVSACSYLVGQCLGTVTKLPTKEERSRAQAVGHKDLKVYHTKLKPNRTITKKVSG